MEAKTAQEILREYTPFYNDHDESAILEAMRTFANQEKAALAEALTAVMPYLDMVSAHVNLSDASLEEFIEIREQAQSALKNEKA